MAIGITIGGVIQPWLIKFLGNWKTFYFVLFAQPVFLLLTPTLVHESVRWLSGQGRTDDVRIDVFEADQFQAQSHARDIPKLLRPFV